MRGIDIWRNIVTLRDTLIEWSLSLYNLFTIPLSSLYVDPNPLLVSTMDRVVLALKLWLGDPSLLDLMFGSFSLIVVAILVKWALDFIF